ncbi:hypothetical protein BFW01_g8818 [Lasiodiplodia theobromae]|nr:hypothetical protein BFW01_g8818 [Lasiodiplodia theobromae]
MPPGLSARQMDPASPQPLQRTSGSDESTADPKRGGSHAKDSSLDEVPKSMFIVTPVGLSKAQELPTVMLVADAGIFDNGKVLYKSGSDQLKIRIKLRRHLLYLVSHHLAAKDIDVITSLAPGNASVKKRLSDVESRAASSLNGSILTKFILPKASKIYEAKLAEDPPVDLLDLGAKERRDIWQKEWESDPKALVSDMWKHVVEYVDLDAIFDCPDNAPTAIKSKMQAWWEYFKECFCTAMDQALCHRIRARRRPAQGTSERTADMVAFDLWRNMKNMQSKPSVLDYHQLPVTAYVSSRSLYERVTEKKQEESRKRQASEEPAGTKRLKTE